MERLDLPDENLQFLIIIHLHKHTYEHERCHVTVYILCENSSVKGHSILDQLMDGINCIQVFNSVVWIVIIQLYKFTICFLAQLIVRKSSVSVYHRLESDAFFLMLEAFWYALWIQYKYSLIRKFLRIICVSEQIEKQALLLMWIDSILQARACFIVFGIQFTHC